MYEGYPFVIEVEFDGILVAQSSGGGTSMMDVYQMRSGRKIYEWMGMSLCLQQMKSGPIFSLVGVQEALMYFQ